MPIRTARPLSFLRCLPVLLAAAVAVQGCGGDGAPDDLSAPPPLAQAEEEAAERMGGESTRALVQTLGGQLQAAMQEGGPTHAVDFCAGRAQELTDSVSGTLGPGVTVTRTALRVRNPANAPDSLDREVLEELVALSQAGDSLPDHVVRVASTEEVRYYRPLLTGGPCVSCHGPENTLDPDLLALIQETYPRDEAVGFQEGDVRGVVKVTVPRDRLNEGP